MSHTSPIALKDVIYKLQLCLLEGIKSETQLLVAGSLLSKSDYHDVVIERSIAQMCGYPLCPNSLPSLEPSQKGRYSISLKEHKVYDLLETRMYCSTKCVIDSRAYGESLQDERSLDFDMGKIDKVVRLFDGLDLKGEEGLGDLGLGNLSIKEKVDENGGRGVVSMEEWIGPSNAVEGYVPQRERGVKNRPGSKVKEVKLKGGEKEEKSMFDELNFMSSIITQGDEYNISKKPCSQTKIKKKHMQLNDKEETEIYDLKRDKVKEVKLKRGEKEEKSMFDELNFMSSIITQGDEYNISKKPCSQTKIKKKHMQLNDKEETEIYEPSRAGLDQPSELKSCLKSKSCSGASTVAIRRNVTWADSEIDSNNQTQVSENGNSFGILEDQLAPIEADTQLGDVVPVSKAGLLPPIQDVVDPEPALLKWPKKTGIVESDFFDSDDSWFDTPPEEFVVDLSPFATMFMSLFAWVSSSTLAYVYGGEGSMDVEYYASINGREYPHKIVSTDGRSSEIKQTLAVCLARALPGLVLHLRLATPVSTVEYGMGCLLETMSFLDPIPALRTKQWHVFLLLFLEALSVSRIPALAPQLANTSFFHKVFEEGQISREEYEVLKDLILPLGRVPQFAMQSGA
ncbi:hypothetical protein R6Q59_018442 [Mikania micrantha]|uniref:RNA polymerase II subunit B1 CTD phosphatase RPAP2 homolog n=1 Tax=Mikania micrantha TaxID=192012 RepID=A0A5N6M0V1_9ASTR|nr:hypothetical protein E3N88_35414 [Mikania micrantha]